MQYLFDTISFAFLIGFAFSILFMILFESDFASSRGISKVPTTYSLGAFISFTIGTTVILGLETPMHSWIGLIGGYLLLSLSIIQAMFDMRKANSERMEHP